jgi:4-amino-4-deoxy-L-arabinose transferase-like glycosyltransferase
VAAIYLRTLSPTTDIGDSLEWVVIARDLGVGHGPGYPLYVLLGKAFQALPVGDLAWRMNLLSATVGVVAVLLTYMFALRLTGTRLAALSGALLLAVSAAFWSLAVITELYTLQVALVAAVLLCLERYTARARAADAGRWLALTAFLLGLALVQHLSNAFLVVVAALAVAHNTPRAAWRTRRLPMA